MEESIPGVTELLTTSQAAEHLNVSTAWLRRRRMLSEAPQYIKLGKTVRYDRADLDRFVDDCRIDP